MRLLLDSNVVVWALSKSDRLKRSAMDILENPANDLYFSIAGVWEIGIKQSTGKLKMPDGYLSILRDQSVKFLPISIEHAYAARSLPRLHKDPFDRMLVVQAMIEDLTIMTHDEMIQAYAVPCLMV
ncbi:MAG: type II toxin-antitoxin system VapC family toxin [Alphaproteobacteria bacterium]|nr:type II toxin-antitoxin system VapC family toxin [Alphaproteobacteria bacterium]